jgi:pimeloyl-ACP methyl ester carboxylesterase
LSFRLRCTALLTGAVCAAPWAIYAQTLTSPLSAPLPHAAERSAVPGSVCNQTKIASVASEALQLVCQRAPTPNILTSAPSSQIIVVGFVGGFVSPGDLHHPENLFAPYLHEHYGDELHAKTFSNHDAKDALSYVQHLLDDNHDGLLSSEEKNKARIIIYGHSWGASQTATFARELGRLEIPVLLTIQIDIIVKPGQTPTIISPNVAEAINFYQRHGPLHGRPMIFASNPAKTTILGNILMDYSHSRVKCSNYSWFVRTFNRPHHEIENDALMWNRIASLIDARITHPAHPGQERSAIATNTFQTLASASSGQTIDTVRNSADRLDVTTQ